EKKRAISRVDGYGRVEPARELSRRIRLARPSREEFAHGEKQAYEREHDEHDLVDVLLAGRQSAQQVRHPEDGIVPESEPGPPFTASVRDHGYHDTKETHPNRGHADRAQGQWVTRTGPRGDNEAEDEDGNSGDRERDPRDLEQNAFLLSHGGEPTHRSG